MYGTWHSYTAGQRWRKPQRQASIVLTVAGKRFVCFNAKEVELSEPGSLRRKGLLQRLGPDLVVAQDFGPIVARARALLSPDTLLVDVLLDQRVASGVGNVYKSEVLFLERVSPVRRLAALPDPQLENLYCRAAGLLRSNLGGGRRVTRFIDDGRGSLWVYKRGGRPCHLCGSAIAQRGMGRNLRSTYWCPGCQA
jgi:endonuclease-8